MGRNHLSLGPATHPHTRRDFCAPYGVVGYNGILVAAEPAARTAIFMSPTLPQRPLRVQSDARLLQLARRGDTPAFEALVRRYRRQLLGYCRRLGMGDAQAEDALQQGLLHAWRALRRGDDVHDVKSWMYRIVHNAALDALRRPGRDNVALDERLHGCAVPSAAGELDRRLTVHATLTELAALPSMQREALVRTAVHGDSHEQVASALGLSHAAVRGLVHRARLAMRAAAGALVPERAIQWLIRSGLGAGVGAPELGAGGASGGGMFAALAKGGAVLATGGVLVTGLLAVHRGHARHTRPFTPPVGHVSARAGAGGRGTLVASAGAPRGAAPRHSGRVDAPRRLSRALSRSGSRPGRARVTVPAFARSGGGPPVHLTPVSSTPGGARGGRGLRSPSSALDTPGFAPRGEDGQGSRQNRDSHAQDGGVSGGGGDSGDGFGSGAAAQSSSGSGQASTTGGHDGNSGGGGSDGGGSSAHIADSSRGSGDSTGGEGSHNIAEGSGAQGEGGSGGEDGTAGKSAEGGETAQSGGTAQDDGTAQGESAAFGSSLGTGSQGASDDGAFSSQGS
jgi:RNA polymerase sigma factor (sigma-70 family)